MGFVDENGVLDRESLLKAQRLSARAGYRMTCVELELPQWNTVQQRDKLIGCSLTGWQDMVNATKMTREQEAELLAELRNVAKTSASEYAKALKQREPLLVTTIKPEGTLSQLPVVSSGVHHSHSPYFIRRIRVNAKDPIVQVCEELGYPIKPEVGQDLETCRTKVVEFPVKAPNGITKYDVSAIEQLENYKMFMNNYIDHNCSITVHVREHEWEEVEQWMWDNWDDVVAVSFLSLDDSFYELLPYEAIDEEEYNRRKSAMRPFVPSLISKYEVEELEDDVVDDSCSTGVCPVR
jgi:ribonucleoside-diphosphate reductase alpha chain/ribonucleoside-triphosphate reductase